MTHQIDTRADFAYRELKEKNMRCMWENGETVPYVYHTKFLEEKKLRLFCAQ